MNPTRLFMYGFLLRPGVRETLGVKGKNWQHGVRLYGYSLTTDWGNSVQSIARLTPTFQGVVFGSAADFSDEEMSRIDAFEGYPNLYKRAEFITDSGPVQAYYGNLSFVQEMYGHDYADDVCGGADTGSTEVQEVPGCEPAGG